MVRVTDYEAKEAHSVVIRIEEAEHRLKLVVAMSTHC